MTVVASLDHPTFTGTLRPPNHLAFTGPFDHPIISVRLPAHLQFLVFSYFLNHRWASGSHPETTPTLYHNHPHFAYTSYRLSALFESLLRLFVHRTAIHPPDYNTIHMPCPSSLASSTAHAPGSTVIPFRSYFVVLL